MEELFNRFLKSRIFFCVCVVIALGFAITNVAIGGGSSWIMLGNFALAIGVALIMLLINANFGLPGGNNSLHATLFILFVTALPCVRGEWVMGNAIAITIQICTAILFSCYDLRNTCTRKLFLIFLILSSMAAVTPIFIWLIPIFIFGAVQMKAFSFRALLAILFGIISPWFLLFTPIQFGKYAFIPISITGFTDINLPSLILYGIMIVTAFLIAGANFFNIIKFKMQKRAYITFTIIIMFWTIVMMLIDFGNALSYLPMLIACLTLQVAVFISNLTTVSKRYIIILFFILMAIIMFAATIHTQNYESCNRIQYTLH